MSHKFLFSSSFHAFLIAIDRELAEHTRQQGCSCGGKLHQANYPRSPLGLFSKLINFRSYYKERFSFCCSSCRKRVTPQSVRFFGRRRSPAPIFILMSALKISINDYRLAQIKQHFGITITESTWKRWRRWWREQFTETKFWKQARGIISVSQKTTLPRGMLGSFKGLIDKKIILLLQLLAPITAGNLRAV